MKTQYLLTPNSVTAIENEFTKEPPTLTISAVVAINSLNKVVIEAVNLHC